MYAEVPEKYDEVYLELARRGARVLAMGYREIGKLSTQELRDMTREDVEKDLKFAGFVIISCPLKTDSKSVIKELQNASHGVVMITGDNALTACHVAKELKFTTHPTLILTESGDTFSWRAIDESVELPLDYDYKDLVKKYDLCITGDGLNYLVNNYHAFLNLILPYITVFARFAPKQKEFVVLQLKNLGYTTLMCGDGTNDVGALKHAHVGVAILTNAPESLPDVKELREKARAQRELLAQPQPRNRPNHARLIEQREKLQANMNKMIKEMEAEEQVQVVKLGDASIASPFTSRLSSIMCSKYLLINIL